MIGIRFITHCHSRALLEKLLSIEPFCAYAWSVPWYIPLQDVPGLQEDTYSVVELRKRLSRLTHEETAEAYCLLGSSDPLCKNFRMPKTVSEYLESEYDAILICVDICELELYCKNEAALLLFKELLIDDKLCQEEQIEILYADMDSRTGFSW